MNDFTKEELQIILLDMDTYINLNKSILKESPSHGQLRLKIQSMIDNYCDHEHEGDFHVCVDKCKKC